MNESQTVSVSVAASGVAVVGAWLAYKLGLYDSVEMATMAAPVAIAAPFIVRYRIRQTAKAKAMRASRFTRPPVPGTRIG